MKLKKLVSALVSGAMILGTMAAVPVFAEGSVGVEYNGTTYTSFTEARGAVASDATEITYTIHGKVVLPSGYITNLTGAASNAETVNFKAADGDATAELALEGTGANIIGLDMAGAVKTVNYDKLILSRANGSWIGDIGHANNYFTTAMRSAADGVVNYTSCTFPNGSCNNFYSKTVYTDCKFNNDTEYGLWIYGGTTEVTGATFTGAKGVQAYSEDVNAYVTTKITDSTFNGITNKPAIISGTKGTVTLENITTTDCQYGLLQTKPKDGNASLPCASVTIDGEEPVYIAKVGSSLYTNETFAEKEAEEKDTTVAPVVAKVNGQFYYSTLADAVAAALTGGTVTLLSDAEGDGVVVPGGSNVTIDLNGFTYNVSGATVGSSGTQTSGFQLLGNRVNGVYSGENNTKVTIKNGTLKATSQSCWILIQNYSDLTLDNVTLDGRDIPNGGGSWPYTLSNNYGTTTITGATNIFARSGGTAFDSCQYGSYSIPTVTVETTGTINGNIELTGGNLIVKSGTFTSNVADYVADGYYQKDNDNGTYTVLPVEAKVIDTAKTTGATVTLDNLNENAVVNPAADATYKVVVSNPSETDAEAANAQIAANNDNNKSKAMFDISVVKVDSNGTETVLNNVTNQKVTLTLGETPSDPSAVRVYHVDSNGVTEIQRGAPNYLTVDGNTVTFIATSFSTYAVTYTAAAVDPNTITDKVGVVFSPVSEGSNQYYVTLKSLKAGKKINRFMSTDLVFKNGCSTVDYDITPAANMTASVISENGTSREYRFNMDGTHQSGASSEIGGGITIGTITFYGYGELDFSVNKSYSSGHSVNIVNTATATNNIVASYMIDGGLLVNNDVTVNLAADEKGTIENVTLKPETKDLTVNIAYNNKINNKAAAYQDMTVTISGGDLSGTKTVELGTTPVMSGFADPANATVTYDADKSAYTVKVANELTQNVAYTVTVEGAGYRTARYTVTMTANKTLNFWNNVLDTAQVVEVGKTEGAVKTNFLAGDIVKDNNINIYDLSAVVSYFGENNLVTAHPEYAKYDLNRDGVIDSKDVAYVLVSWGK